MYGQDFLLTGPMADVDYSHLLKLMEREPDVLIGPKKDDPHIRRWHVVPRNNDCNIYLHEIRKNDDDRALHDHPYHFISIILEGGYREYTVDSRAKGKSAGRLKSEIYKKGMVNHKKAEEAHRLEIIGGQPAITLLISGPRIREWGFHCPKGWKPWHQFIDERDYGVMKGGCD